MAGIVLALTSNVQAQEFAVTGTCESGSQTGFVNQLGGTEVHALGVYESRGDHSGGNHPRGTTHVSVSRTGVPIILVLSSYEPTHWVLSVANGVQLQQVILNGYHTQTIEGQGGAAVTYKHQPGNYFTACAYQWPTGNGGCDSDALVDGAQDFLGQPVDSFHGCYRSTGFTIGIADSDGDGIADGDDPCPEDATNDLDEDGLCGLVDNCPLIPNADQADADSDDIGDVCDPCPNDANPNNDGDNVCGDVDNCPRHHNPDQVDDNGDGHGDVCVNPDAGINRGVEVGAGAEIGRGAQVGGRAEVGEGARLGDHRRPVVAGGQQQRGQPDAPEHFLQRGGGLHHRRGRRHLQPGERGGSSRHRGSHADTLPGLCR